MVQNKHFETLINPETKIGDKYKSIFELKQLQNQEGKDLLIEAFPYLRNSELLLHEVSYALGQLQHDPKTEQFLKSILSDENEYPVVRHEAGEALSNYGFPEMKEFLQQFTNHKQEEIRDTCLLGVDKINNYNNLKQLYGNKYMGTIEPSAPFTEEELQNELKLNQDISQDEKYNKILSYILDENNSLFKKYRAMYYLRNDGSQKAIKILTNIIDPTLENRKRTNVLLRHEVFFIFGQLGEKVRFVSETIRKVIEDQDENGIVRHEAIGAYSGISDDNEIILKYCNDESRIVKDSCQVAVDMIEFWNTKDE